MYKLSIERVLLWILISWISARAALRYDDVFWAVVYTVAVIFLAALIVLFYEKFKNRKIGSWFAMVITKGGSNTAFGPFKSEKEARRELDTSPFIANYMTRFEVLDTYVLESPEKDIPRTFVRIKYEYTNA